MTEQILYSKMSFNDFKIFLQQYISDFDSISDENIHFLFDLLDQDRDGVLSKNEANVLAACVRYFTNSIKCALIVVDFQNDFVCGSLAIKNGPAHQDPLDALISINRLLTQKHFDMVVYTKDWHPPNHMSFTEYPPHCVQNTWGAQLYADLVIASDAKYIHKGTDVLVDCFSGFIDNNCEQKTELENWLKGRKIEIVFVCGLAYDICVAATAKDAARLGFYTAVITDCSKGLSKENINEVNKEFGQLQVALVNTKQVEVFFETKKVPFVWMKKICGQALDRLNTSQIVKVIEHNTEHDSLPEQGV